VACCLAAEARICRHPLARLSLNLERTLRRSFLRNIASLSLVSLCLPALVSASEDAAGYESVKVDAVDLYFFPDTYSFVTHIDENILEQFGCRYYSNDPKVTADLMKAAVSAGQGIPAREEDVPKFEFRNKLVFHSNEGKDVIIIFSQKFSNLPYLMGYWNGVSAKLWPRLRERILEIVGQQKLKQTNDKAPQSCGIS
jgi:hypothetical protein